MTQNGLAIPTEIATPRCFVLPPVLDKSRALMEAGEHKVNVFNFDFKRAIAALGRRDENSIDIRLLHRRLVSFWNVKCRSHFDYTRMQDYTIAAHNPDAVLITLQGLDTSGSPIESPYRVDQSGRGNGVVKLTGIERCITNREVLECIDSYTQTDTWAPKQVEAQQKHLQELALQHPAVVQDLEGFVRDLTLNGQPLFADNVETVVVPPLETADNVVRRMLKKVMVSIEAATIFDWKLEVAAVDLYFRPIFIFEFSRLDRNGNPVEKKLEELDGVKPGHWVNLQTTEYQTSNIPWVKILKLSADIGSIVLGDVPVVGTAVKVVGAIAAQGPGIADDMRR